MERQGRHRGGDHDEVRVFVKAARTGAGRGREGPVNRLLLDGRAIAAAITLSSGDRVAVESSYDEE